MGLVKKCYNLLKLEQLYDNKKLPEQNVITYLKLWNPRLKQDKFGNLYLINPGTPILNAHMDTVQKTDDTVGCTKKLKIKRDRISAKNCIIGGDDKCGIAIAMQIYEEMGDKVSLLFTRQEEVGCVGITNVFTDLELTKLIEQSPYALTLDRRGNGDIIGYQNGYCSEEFENRIEEITKSYGYKSEHGLISDANHISKHINCVNLSVGYYNPHSKQEYIDCKDLINAYEAVKQILLTIKNTEKFEIYKAPVSNYSYNSYNRYNGYTGGLFDYGDYYNDFYGGGVKQKSSKKNDEEDLKSTPSKKEINKLLKYFQYDEKSDTIYVKKDIELYNTVGVENNYDIVDIYKGRYYLDDLDIIGDDEDKDDEDDEEDPTKIKYGI